MDFSDLIYIAFLVICAALAAGISSGGGGGRRSRIPAAC